MRIFTFIFIFIFAFSCFSQENKNYMSSCSLINKPEVSVRVVDDLFISEFLNKHLSWVEVSKKLNGMRVQRTQVKNNHNASNVNYILTAEDGQDNLSYYLGDGNTFLLCAIIKTERFELPKNIYIGQDVSFFSKKFSVPSKVGVISVESLEGNNSIELYFSEGKLFQIKYKSDYWD